MHNILFGILDREFKAVKFLETYEREFEVALHVVLVITTASQQGLMG